MAVNLSPVGGVAGQFFDNNGDPLVGGKLFTYAAGTTTPQVTYTSSSGATPNSNPIILNAGGRVPSEIWLTDGLVYKFVLYSSTDQLIGSWDNIVGINSNFVNFVTSEEVQIATAGQTVFTLTTMSYQPGLNNLVVYVDGVNQVEGGSYSFVETNSTTVTFTAGLHLGAVVKFVSAETLTTVGSNANVIAYEPAGAGAVTTTVQAKLRETVSVKDFGAVGDGVTDDTAAIQAALDYADGGELHFPKGTYKVTATLNFPDNTRYSFDGYSSIIDYYGTGAAVKFTNAKDVLWESGHILLANADDEAIGIYLNGCQLCTFVSPKIQTSSVAGLPNEQTAIKIDTNNYAGYMIKIIAPYLRDGYGKYGIWAQKTLGDPREVTHLSIEGGWIWGKATGIYFNGVNSSTILYTGVENGDDNGYGDGIFIENSAHCLVMPGELGNAFGYGINYGAGNSGVTQYLWNTIGNGGASGFANYATYNPPNIGRAGIKRNASTTNQDYWFSLDSFQASDSFILSARGPSTANLLTYNSDASTGYLKFGSRRGWIFARSGVDKFIVGGDGSIAPSDDNAVTCGNNTNRWSAVWAVNGTIQTSDERTKTNIQTASLGLDFINQLRPVSYNWKVGGKKAEIIGTKTVVTGTTEDGTVLTEERNVERIAPTPGARTHWGLIAQEVKSVCDNAGVDFGGWILTDKENPDSEQALRYDQFIAPLIKAVQELSARVSELEKQNG